METTIQVSNDNGIDRVNIVGPINEEGEIHLANLASQLGDKIVINFKQVTFINSLGVRAWVNFIRQLDRADLLEFEECTPEIVNQINMIPNFKGNAEIKSVYGTYFCEECSHVQNQIFEAGKTLPTTDEITLPEVKCEKCGEEMEFEEVEDAFFAFAIAG